MKKNFKTPDFSRLPKVSLDQDLLLSCRPETIFELSIQEKVALAAQSADQIREAARASAVEGTIEQFKNEYVLPVLTIKDNLARIARECVEDAAADGVIYAEVAWNPSIRTVGGLSADQSLKAINQGLEEGVDSVLAGGGHIRVHLVLNLNNFEIAADVIEMSQHNYDKGVVGVSAFENPGFVVSKNLKTFVMLAQTYIPVSVMLSRGSLRSISDSLVVGRALRISNAFGLVDDITFIESGGEEDADLGCVATWIHDRDLLLGFSPHWDIERNALGNKVTSFDDHPFALLYELGFTLGVLAAPRVGKTQPSCVTDEFMVLAREFGYGEEDFLDFTLNCVEGSFLHSEEKEELRTFIVSEYETFLAS